MTGMELNKALASAMYPGAHHMEVRKTGVIKLKVDGEVKTVDYRDGNLQKELCESLKLMIDISDSRGAWVSYAVIEKTRSYGHFNWNRDRSTAIALCAIEVLNAKNKAQA